MTFSVHYLTVQQPTLVFVKWLLTNMFSSSPKAEPYLFGSDISKPPTTSQIPRR